EISPFHEDATGRIIRLASTDRMVKEHECIGVGRIYNEPRGVDGTCKILSRDEEQEVTRLYNFRSSRHESTEVEEMTQLYGRMRSCSVEDEPEDVTTLFTKKASPRRQMISRIPKPQPRKVRIPAHVRSSVKKQQARLAAAYRGQQGRMRLTYEEND
ncbi:hypothetical protein PROFUN_11183, partial [Planoprotostelium fungivorum]